MKLELHKAALVAASDPDRTLWTAAALAFGATPDQASEAVLVTDTSFWWWMQWTGGFDPVCFYTHASSRQDANAILRNKIATEV